MNNSDPYEFRNYIAMTYLWPYLPPLFLLIGTVTNTLSIIIFTRNDMKKHSSFVYFAFLNIVNITALYTNCIRGILDFNFSIDIRAASLFICKFHVFLTYFLCHLSSLILSSISIDRVISVMFLRLSKTTCTPRVAIQVTICLAVFNFILSSHFLYLESGYKAIEETTDNNKTIMVESIICDIRVNTDYYYFVQNVWKLVDMSMYALVPFLIMLASSIIIIIRIRQQSKKLQSHDQKTPSKESRVSSKTRNLAMMLIPVNIMFLIFVGPVVIAIYTYTDLGRDHMALVIVEVLSNCNFTLNFFVYFATSSKFREEFYKFLNEICNKLHIQRESRANLSNSSSRNMAKLRKVNKLFGDQRHNKEYLDELSKEETFSLTAAKEQIKINELN